MDRARYLALPGLPCNHFRWREGGLQGLQVRVECGLLSIAGVDTCDGAVQCALASMKDQDFA